MIILLSIGVITLIIYLCGSIYGKTLGALPTIIVWAVLYVIGLKWTSAPKCDPEEDRQDDTSDSE
ncbi:MAG: hypothetical protein EOM54_00235 [Clostridia bacterium]|nr:hypothetical protein [Clostridia bacterium]